MAQKIVIELTEQLRMTQKGRIKLLLDPHATPEQNDKADKALAKAREALVDAVIDDLQNGQRKVDELTTKTKIKNNSRKIKTAIDELKGAVAMVKLFGEVIKLSVDVMKVVA